MTFLDMLLSWGFCLILTDDTFETIDGDELRDEGCWLTLSSSYESY